MAQRDIAADAVEHALAKDAADKLASYLSRGRQFKMVSIEALQSAFDDSFRKYILSGRSRLENDDVCAEFDLRGVDPSFENVQAEFKILQERARAAASAEDADDRIGGAIIDDYFANIMKRH